MIWKGCRTKRFGIKQDYLPTFAQRDIHNTQNLGAGSYGNFAESLTFVKLAGRCYFESVITLKLKRKNFNTFICENVIVNIFILIYFTLFQISQYFTSVIVNGMPILNQEYNLLLQEVSAKSKPKKSWTFSIINSFKH